MRKVDLLDNPYFIFTLFLITGLVSIISSIYFISILLSGILFLAFMRTFKLKAYYSLMFVLLSFLFVELNNGFKPFSLTLLAFFTYTFVVPYLKRVISLHDLNAYVYMLCFYVGVGGLWTLTHSSSFKLVGTLLFNIFLDFIIFGFFI